MHWFIGDRGQTTWDIGLDLHPGYHAAVWPGPVVVWQPAWIRAVEDALSRLPRKLVLKAAPVCLFAAEQLSVDLPAGGVVSCPGISSEVQPCKTSHLSPAIKPPEDDLDRNPTLYWIGLEAACLADPFEEEPDLSEPVLLAVLLEELAHVWDFRLEAQQSPFTSSPRFGTKWEPFAPDPVTGIRKPFAIPNRKPDTGDIELNSAEDWASALVWFVLRPEELRGWAPDHCAFVEELFTYHRIT